MKRKLDLIRTILLEAEQRADGTTPTAIRAPGHAPDVVAYHVKLLAEAGCLEAVDLSTPGELAWLVRSLTWQGHELLDALRPTPVWQQLRARLKDRAMDAPLSVVQRLATQIGAAMLGVDCPRA